MRLFTKCTATLVILVFATAEPFPPLAMASELPEWEQRETLDNVTGTLAAMAHFCSANFGYVQLPSKSVAERRDKLDSYLLLKADPVGQLQAWLELIHRWTSLMDKDGPLTERASDAVGAAVADPDAYEQAEQLYVNTLMDGARGANSACLDAASDPFIAKNYLSGAGELPLDETELRKQFADSVKEVTLYKDNLRRKPH